jgi:hypothetical protein
MSASIDMKEILARLSLKARRDLAIIEKASGRFAAILIGRAQDITPVKTGFLQASGTWEQPQITEDNVIINVGFNASYAAIVHELPPERAHHEPPGQWKYLEVTLRNEGPKFVPYVASELRKAN